MDPNRKKEEAFHIKTSLSIWLLSRNEPCIALTEPESETYSGLSFHPGTRGDHQTWMTKRSERQETKSTVCLMMLSVMCVQYADWLWIRAYKKTSEPWYVQFINTRSRAWFNQVKINTHKKTSRVFMFACTYIYEHRGG